jgi:hypothetical protein
MKFSDILKTENINIQNSFLLGMIYARPILTNNNEKIIAYSSYRYGDRSNNHFERDIEEYFKLHKNKLISFLGDNFKIERNTILRENYSFDSGIRIQNGVSIIIDFDLDFPENIDKDIYIYGLIEKWLIDADEKYKKIFLTGAMDARGSLDFTARYISLDIIEKDAVTVKRKLSRFNDILGAIFNYNPRLTQEQSFPKNDQFRIPLYYFIGHFGLLTPFKIDYYKAEKKYFQEKIKDDFFFIDSNFEKLDAKTNISDRNLEINELAIKLQDENLSEEERKEIIERYKENNLSLDTDDEIMYSSQNMKELSKRLSEYMCEFSQNHKTFTAKSNNKQFIEAHHLIPFSERKKFDVSIDVIENIVCLCPNCHRKVHLAIDEERTGLLKPLFEKKKDQLEKIGIKVDLSGLFDLYKILNQ